MSSPSTTSTQFEQPQFVDFDQDATYLGLTTVLKSVDAKNFILDFDNARAECAVNLEEDKIARLLSTERTENPMTRWINIWCPEKQKIAIKAVAKHYGFSPRLTGLMCCEPLKPVLLPNTQQRRGMQQAWQDLRKDRKERKNNVKKDAELRMEKEDEDLEMQGGIPETSPAQSRMKDFNHYKIVNEVWHFSSVDWGQKYLCIGYNALFNTTESVNPDNAYRRRNENKPAGKRLYTWLILCNDGTIISIHENPFPGHTGNLTSKEQSDLIFSRENLSTVIHDLSRSKEAKNVKSPIGNLSIRSHDEKAPFSRSDASSLLLYYLFDDWFTSYSLVAREEHQYGLQLEQLRERMFETASLSHVDELHHYGRQLQVLKRMYQSYENIVQRVLEGTKGAQGVGMVSGALAHTQEQVDVQRARAGDDAVYGISISTAAASRFVRLKDRISHYALSEIQDCLNEKEALVQVNFSLIAMKESSAVESLTRITILLAKVTILFMPVSLMTSYFSVQIADLQGVYTHVTYWVSFAVVMGLSLAFLIVFGQLSGTQEGKVIYRSLTKTALLTSKAIFKRKKKYQD